MKISRPLLVSKPILCQKVLSKSAESAINRRIVAEMHSNKLSFAHDSFQSKIRLLLPKITKEYFAGNYKKIEQELLIQMGCTTSLASINNVDIFFQTTIDFFITKITAIRALFLMLSLKENKNDFSEKEKISSFKAKKHPLEKEIKEKLKNKHGIYMDLNKAWDQIIKHGFNAGNGAKHMHEFVKVAKLPNLFICPEFGELNRNPESEAEFFRAANYTQRILDLFALVIVIIGYSSLLNSDYVDIKSQPLGRTPRVMSFVCNEIKEFLKIDTTGTQIALKVTALTIQIKFEIIINQTNTSDSISFADDMQFVFYVTPNFSGVFSDNNVIQIVTGFIITDKATREKFPNHKNLLGGEKNFSDKENAIKSFYVFIQQIGERYPLMGEKGLISQLVELSNESLTEKECRKKKTEAAILTHFNNINPFNCNLCDFKKRVDYKS